MRETTANRKEFVSVSQRGMCCKGGDLVYNVRSERRYTMETIVLGSGSKGNATLIRSGRTTLLVDAGLSYRAMNRRLEGSPLSLADIDAVLLTHEHNDHIRGLRMVMKKNPVPLYTAESVLAALPADVAVEEFFPLEPHTYQSIGDFEVYPVPLSHDTETTLGFVFLADGKKIVYATDTGFIDEKLHPVFHNADAYILEANYDVEMLFTSERPYSLKRRIDSVRGHLSNADSAYYLSRFVGERTKVIVLAHPSEECNTPERALSTFQDIFASYEIPSKDYEVHIANQHVPTKLFRI